MTSSIRTIAISRQRGTGGAFVGRALADRLNFRYIDREMLRDASEYLSTKETEEQAAEAAGSWWSRLGKTFALGGPDCGYVPPTTEAVYEGELFEIQKRIIAEVCEGEASVVVGRGAAQSLHGRRGVVTAFLHAPEAWRIERVQELYGLDAAKARKDVHDSDRDRRQFIRALADIDWTDARAYDISLDTSTLGFEATIDLLARAAGSSARL
jgi:cytidylate kinase